jgi:hypothetical protein
MTGGNPFYLRELIRAVSEEGGHPTAALAARVREFGVRTIGRRVLVRLALLGGECEALAQGAPEAAVSYCVAPGRSHRTAMSSSRS